MKTKQMILLWRYAMVQKSKVVLATACSILNKICDIVPEILIGIAIDVVVNQRHSIVARIFHIDNPLHQLYLVACLTAILWILESVFEYWYLILWRDVAHGVQHGLRRDTYASLQQLDMSYYERTTTGGLLTILQDDINQLEQFLSEVPNAVLQLAVNIVVMGAIFFYISPVIAFVTLLPIPFVLGTAYYFQHRLAYIYGDVRESASSLGSHMASRLLGMITIRSYVTESYENARLAAESMTYQEAYQKLNRCNAAYIPLVRMGVLTGFILSMLVGGYYALQGMLSISSYSVVVFLTQRFLWPFTTLTSITDLYERAAASLRRISGILHHKRTIFGGTHPIAVQEIKGSVQFERVAFAYSNGTKLFTNLSFAIPARTTVAFVGATGSGKSTIMKLLLRFYDIQEGVIKLDNKAIGSLPLDNLRQAIALVSQEIYLVDGTIRDNITYGTFDADFEAVVQAAKMAEAHEFIMNLPEGYETLVGENGKNLSGGQRQRISIARAMVKNPSIFIFDEATSAVDNETEAAIQRSLATLGNDHTMILIAHRLSTVRHAHTIFVMGNGEIIESGSHDELLRKNGSYANLWRIQTGEII